jgi:hypothetical protein
MQTAVTFTSKRFRPVLPEESQVNPGRYGAELAFWLCTALAREGVVTSYPNFEDWGWFIEFATTDEDEFWLCCGNVDDADDEWHCFLQPKTKGLLGRVKPSMERSRPLLEALSRVLDAETSVHDIRWSDEKGE